MEKDMTGETDAAFVERQIQEHEEYLQATGEGNAEYERVLEIARAHAAPRTVQAGVTDAMVKAAAIQNWALEDGTSIAATARLFDDEIATMKHSGDCTKEAHTCLVCFRQRELDKARTVLLAALEAAASVPTAAPACSACGDSQIEEVYGGHGSVLELPCSRCSPASPAACSCGGVAWQPIETAPKDGRKVWLAVKGRDTAIKAHWCTSFGEGPNGWFDGGRIHAKLVYAWHDVETPPQLPAFPSTPSTPCACYRAGIERAAEIAEAYAKHITFRGWIDIGTGQEAARAIASDIRRAGEEPRS